MRRPPASRTGAVAPEVIADGLRHQRDGVGREHRRAVMLGAIAGVERVSLVEAVDHLVDSRRPVDGQWRFAARDPGLQPQLAQLGDVVGVEMRDQDRVDLFERHAPQEKVARAVDAGIDEIEMSACSDERAGTGAIAVGKRRSRSAQQAPKACSDLREPVRGARRHGRPASGTARSAPRGHAGSRTRRHRRAGLRPRGLRERCGAWVQAFIRARHEVRAVSDATKACRCGPGRRTARPRTPWSARPSGRPPRAPPGSPR